MRHRCTLALFILGDIILCQGSPTGVYAPAPGNRIERFIHWAKSKMSKNNVELDNKPDVEIKTVRFTVRTNAGDGNLVTGGQEFEINSHNYKLSAGRSPFGAWFASYFLGIALVDLDHKSPPYHPYVRTVQLCVEHPNSDKCFKTKTERNWSTSDDALVYPKFAKWQDIQKFLNGAKEFQVRCTITYIEQNKLPANIGLLHYTNSFE